MTKLNLGAYKVKTLWKPTYARDWGIGRNPATITRGGKGEHCQTGTLLHSSDPDYVALRRKHKQPKRVGLRGEYTA